MTSSGASPGERFAYDGDRFALLDEVVRHGSGRTFADLTVAWIIELLGLVHTAPNVDNAAAFQYSKRDADAFRANVAKPYTLTNGGVTPSRYPNLFSVAAGMISSLSRSALS